MSLKLPCTILSLRLTLVYPTLFCVVLLSTSQNPRAIAYSGVPHIYLGLSCGGPTPYLTVQISAAVDHATTITLFYHMILGCFS
ncbi:hypothetical protein HETIRDRAFT_470877 [Heterobasidion irregulare TC 32-1]|uniref:Uncharacterized protein n=1 Tax=Heterobasidion irregulare (strain TC 32-1) TaxID=747525 RepID=W4KK83_HETIT|nr:uncharacterized protein HETIRDRAFT_470877 [Heterobasidion irregulare TC 32-1]ETW85735.1 hypothetical protein HETIRDRAFT_470877 [Heterobasidion irregulare TC 32-1]